MTPTRVPVLMGWIGCLAMATTLTVSAQSQVALAVWHNDQMQWHPSRVPEVQRVAEAAPPLGSLWKLLTYSYLVGTGAADTPYTCQADTHADEDAQREESYCCTLGETIDRDTALVRSCGRYFEPQRLGIESSAWRRYWQAQQAPEWVHDLRQLQPATRVPVDQLLRALDRLPTTTRVQAREVLLGRLLQPQWGPTLQHMGSGYRFKTYAWDHPTKSKAYWGGGAGWLADGTPFWFGGEGVSRQVAARIAPDLPRLLPLTTTQAIGGGCVSVDFLRRTPIASLQPRQSDQAHTGVLRGTYLMTLSNGRSLKFDSNGALAAQRVPTGWQLEGRFSIEEYVARVIDREASAQPAEAAKALAVVARSYLYQNGRFERGCWHIADDTARQRVSLQAPSRAAQQVAAMTEGLVLAGPAVYYHRDESRRDTLAWTDAVAQAHQGRDFASILKTSLIDHSWRLPNQQPQCERQAAAEQWIERQLIRHRERLHQLTGYQKPQGFKVCRLTYGRPYTDQNTLEIYVPGWRTAQEQTALWHETLHLALRHHPNGRNERLIEQYANLLAQQTNSYSDALLHSH